MPKNIHNLTLLQDSNKSDASNNSETSANTIKPASTNPTTTDSANNANPTLKTIMKQDSGKSEVKKTTFLG
jgi:hypothetical protein